MKVAFSTRRFSEGYSTDQVDDFIDRVERALLRGDGSLTPGEVLSHRFDPVRFVEGYDMDQVDTFLEEVLLPMLKGEATYDPEHDYSLRLEPVGEVSDGSETDVSSGRGSSEPRPGFFSRLFGGGR